ncbi:uncharacterized protein LOC131348048 [Hemibagrus wyckioides]|uniref:uncharacterized protein LOC131348048 n=1 Tax=Hemibagrus wyckioides TaxID=337641 RepID=UPI00266BA4B2|nr:uncharacterized protein LOC131348048 [Hemibagrus wyckioides]
MISAKGLLAFLKKRVTRFGIFSLILVVFEQILDKDFVCPCKHTYNITVCVLYGAVPSIGCFLLTFFFMDLSLNTDGRRKEISTCNKVLYSSLTASIWLFLFFADGRYLACALSAWEGVYAKSDTLGIEKWCKPTGNETSELESQQITLKWISISQILGFFIILLVVVLLACVQGTQRALTHRNITERECDEDSRENLQRQLGERNSRSESDEDTCL